MQVVTDAEGNTARIAVAMLGPRCEVGQDDGIKTYKIERKKNIFEALLVYVRVDGASHLLIERRTKTGLEMLLRSVFQSAEVYVVLPQR